MKVAVLTQDIRQSEVEILTQSAMEAANFLKTIGHHRRLLILCHLASGEKSVSELEVILQARQAAVSQLLSRLRQEGMVARRRDGKTVYYRLSDDRSREVIALIYKLFCKKD